MRWTSAVGHGLYVWSVLERLVEVADAACDVGVARDGQRDDRNPAESEPRIALGDVGGHVAAVVALAHHALIAWDFLSEGVLSAHKEEEHDEVCKRATMGYDRVESTVEYQMM